MVKNYGLSPVLMRQMRMNQSRKYVRKMIISLNMFSKIMIILTNYFFLTNQSRETGLLLPLFKNSFQGQLEIYNLKSLNSSINNSKTGIPSISQSMNGGPINEDKQLLWFVEHLIREVKNG